MEDLSLSCSCGQIQAVIRAGSAGRGTRLSCYCNDCQAFAHFLGRAGEILDAHGGSDIYQISPAQLQFTRGIEQLACVRLRPKGLLRWYAGCCKTPFGNTMPTPNIPFAGMVTSCIQRRGGVSLDSLIGPPGKGVYGRFAKGDRSAVNAYDSAPLAMIVSTLGKVLWRRLRGDHRRSPLFDKRSGQPAAVPLVLDEQALQRIERLRDGSRSG